MAPWNFFWEGKGIKDGHASHSGGTCMFMCRIVVSHMEELLAHTRMSSRAAGQLLVELVEALNARKFRGEQCEQLNLLYTKTLQHMESVFSHALPVIGLFQEQGCRGSQLTQTGYIRDPLATPPDHIEYCRFNDSTGKRKTRMELKHSVGSIQSTGCGYFISQPKLSTWHMWGIQTQHPHNTASEFIMIVSTFLTMSLCSLF